jgi:hypothetical protein
MSLVGRGALATDAADGFVAAAEAATTLPGSTIGDCALYLKLLCRAILRDGLCHEVSPRTYVFHMELAHEDVGTMSAVGGGVGVIVGIVVQVAGGVSVGTKPLGGASVGLAAVVGVGVDVPGVPEAVGVEVEELGVLVRVAVAAFVAVAWVAVVGMALFVGVGLLAGLVAVKLTVGVADFTGVLVLVGGGAAVANWT